MTSSIKQLFKSPYNLRHPLFALYRLLIWKVIRVLKLQSVPFKLWGNRKIYLNYNSFQSAWTMYNYWVDWEEFNAIKDNVKEGDIVFDVGANIGTYVLWSSKFTGHLGSVHAFEPDPTAFRLLEKNIHLNRLSAQVTLNQRAISEKQGDLKFSVGLDIQNQIVEESSINYQIIKSDSIDRYIEQNKIKRIKYLKIDIEGYEYKALLGAGNALRSGTIDVIQLEINEKIINSSITPAELLDFVNQLGYILCGYDCTNGRFFEIPYVKTRENYFLINNKFLESQSKV